MDDIECVYFVQRNEDEVPREWRNATTIHAVVYALYIMYSGLCTTCNCIVVKMLAAMHYRLNLFDYESTA